jgi:hypothetical protein
MRFSKTGWLFLGSVLTLTIWTIISFAFSDPREHKLHEGPILRLEKLAYGKLMNL